MKNGYMSMHVVDDNNAVLDFYLEGGTKNYTFNLVEGEATYINIFKEEIGDDDLENG